MTGHRITKSAMITIAIGLGFVASVLANTMSDIRKDAAEQELDRAFIDCKNYNWSLAHCSDIRRAWEDMQRQYDNDARAEKQREVDIVAGRLKP